MGFRYVVVVVFFFFFGFLVLLHIGFLVFDFLCGFDCDYGLWLKWRFGGYVSGDLVAMVMVAISYVGGCDCVGFDCNSGL